MGQEGEATHDVEDVVAAARVATRRRGAAEQREVASCHTQYVAHEYYPLAAAAAAAAAATTLAELALNVLDRKQGVYYANALFSSKVGVMVSIGLSPGNEGKGAAKWYVDNISGCTWDLKTSDGDSESGERKKEDRDVEGGRAFVGRGAGRGGGRKTANQDENQTTSHTFGFSLKGPRCHVVDSDRNRLRRVFGRRLFAVCSPLAVPGAVQLCLRRGRRPNRRHGGADGGREEQTSPKAAAGERQVVGERRHRNAAASLGALVLRHPQRRGVEGARGREARPRPRALLLVGAVAAVARLVSWKTDRRAGLHARCWAVRHRSWGAARCHRRQRTAAGRGGASD